MAAGSIGRAVMQVTFDTSDGEKELRSQAGRIVGDLASVFAGAKLFDFARGGLDELKQQEAAAAQTAAAIKSTGGAAQLSADQIAGLASELSNLSGKDDEAIQGAENLLLTFRSIKGDNFKEATAAVLDLSVAFGQDLQSSAIQVGKALEDPIQGVTALRRVGVQLTDSQEATIKALVATGDTAEAQRVILKELETQVGGSAKAYGETLPGQLERARTSIDNAKGALVSGLAPALELGADLATKAAEGFQSLPEGLQETIGVIGLVGGGIGSIARPVSDVINIVSKLRTAHQAAAAATTVQAGATEGLAAAEGTAAAAGQGLLASLGPLAIALGVAAGAVALFGGDTVDAGGNVKKLAAQTGDAAAEMIRNMSGFDRAVTLNKLVDSGQEGIGTLIKLRDASAEGSDEWRMYDAAVQTAVGNQRTMNETQKAGADAVDGLTAGVDDQKDSMKELAAAADAVKSKIDSVATASHQLLSADLRAQLAPADIADAQARATDAQAKLNEAQAAGDPKAIAQAQRDLERAQVDVTKAVDDAAEAATELKVQQDAANGTVDDAYTKNVTLADSLRILADGLTGPYRDAVQGQIDQLDQVNARLATQIQYENDLRALSTGNLNDNVVDPGFAGSPIERNFGGRRALGGPVDAATPYIVGERGPEMFVPRVSGAIVPNDMLAGVASGGGGFDIHGDVVFQTYERPPSMLELANQARAVSFLAGG